MAISATQPLPATKPCRVVVLEGPGKGRLRELVEDAAGANQVHHTASMEEACQWAGLAKCLIVSGELPELRALLAAVSSRIPVVVAGGHEPRRVVDAFRCGATDYILDQDLTSQALEEAIHIAAGEAEWRDAQERFQIAASTSHISIFDWDVQNGRVDRFHGCLEMTGYSAEEDDGSRQWWVDRIHPDDRHGTLGAKAPQHTGNEVVSEYRIQHKDGRWVWLREHARLMRDAAGAVIRVIGSRMDITSAKTAEQELRESEDRFRRSSDASRSMVYDLDLTGARPALVHGLERVTGFDSSRVVVNREWWISRTHPDDREQCIREFETVLRSGSHWQRTYRIEAASGEWRDVEDQAEVIRDDGGHPVRLVGTVVDVSERMNVLRQLSEGETHYRQLFEANPNPMWVYDMETLQILAVNDAAVQQYGYTRDEFLGLRISDVRVPEPLPATVDEKPCSHRKKDGSIVEVAMASHDLPWEGRPARLVLLHDITLRKRAEEALRERERRFRGIFDSTYQYIGLLSPEGTVVEANRASCDAVGLGPENIIGQPYWETPWWWGHDEERARLREGVQRAAAGEFLRWEAKYRNKDQEEAIVDFSLSPVRDEQGRVVLLVPEGRDITAMKRAEHEVLVARERLQLIVDACGVGISFLDLRSGRMKVNAALKIHFGVGSEERLTRDLFLLRIHDEDRRRVWESWERAMNDGTRMELEFRTVDEVGTVRWIRTTGQSSRSEDGRPHSFYTVNIDVTDQKHVEETLRAANEDLNRFAYAAAHDLREPLRNIGTCTEVLVSVLDNPARAMTAERTGQLKHAITEGVRRMDQLLADLLEYSFAGHGDGEIPETDAGAALQKAVDNLRDAIELSGARIVPRVLPRIRAREQEIVSVLQNLLSNAMKYHGSDQPRIEVKAEARSGEWLFSVKDNGEGIEEAFRRHIFGMFKRLHGRDVPGTGIGLAICEKIVTKYGGRIWVESEVGSGSTFFFTWPMRRGRSGQ